MFDVQTLSFLSSEAVVRPGDTCGSIAYEICKIPLEVLLMHNEELLSQECNNLQVDETLCCDYEDE